MPDQGILVFSQSAPPGGGSLGLAHSRLARAGTLRPVWVVWDPACLASAGPARCRPKCAVCLYIGGQIPPLPWCFCLGIARTVLYGPQNCTRGPGKAHSAPTYIRRILPACGGMCLLPTSNMYISLVVCQTQGCPPGEALGENTNIPRSGTPAFPAH